MKYTKYGIAISTGAMMVAIILVLSNAVGQVPDSKDAQLESVRVRYARATLDLAEVELKIALTENEKIPNLYSQWTVRRLSNSVAYAKEILRYETEGEDNGIHGLHVWEVEGELAVAESELANAVRLNKELPGSFKDLQIERLRATEEVARMALEKARDPAVMKSYEDHLQWQLDRMRSELTRLYVLIDKSLSRN